ncbi:hypothetical protein G3N55_08060 [Dissulfurirhabdus thermomarina]|uniref:Uncharacterized protein n=1 Tax=Dissulfurirhabdus thermomarina TaxID=1765737 RepID=A0A6N9TNG6_DISTH|nr:hypothetical protein [Dissulfurirhabdus thermomarina]NDY42795.1 hypothetical protein [Dissulfurirhabdus thermomarina]NMX23863.1 hypothetical protein [Dissulfurirhabdus thermomarina]
MNSAAHKKLIHNYLNWEDVEKRLDSYEFIKAVYPIKDLLCCSETAPYYCHYLAWRLGTWKRDEFFEFFNDLLKIGVKLEGWENNKNLLKSCDYDVFWGLLWQLQVAKFFCDQGHTVTWMNSPAPDLRVTAGESYFFVECYTYRKSFRILSFIEELFLKIDPRIRVDYRACTKLSIPDDKNGLNRFLDELFRPYIKPEFLREKIRESKTCQPVELPVPDAAFHLYVEGDDPSKYVPSCNATGGPDLYLKNVLHELIKNKQNSNKLSKHHPNILAVNCILQHDLEWVFDEHQAVGEQPSIDLGKNLDGVLVFRCGINELPSPRNCLLRRIGPALEAVRGHVDF